ncbi:MAG: excinuclease ABC subunit A, partial [Planctomycetes bacterium]|nr:excinuclease ABC subunit A [Planctomycetota bacterium]
MLEKPDADRIENIPPAIAVRQGAGRPSARATVATATEVFDALRFLFARIGRIVCSGCGVPVLRQTPGDVLADLRRLEPGRRFQIAFPCDRTVDDEALSALRHAGFRRAIVVQHVDRRRSAQNEPVRRGEPGTSVDSAVSLGAGRTVALEHCRPELLHAAETTHLWVVVDRLVAGRADDQRVADSLEQAFFFGAGQCIVLEEGDDVSQTAQGSAVVVDGRSWLVHQFSERFRCARCGKEYPDPDPHLFSFESPMGACPTCHGFGRVPTISFDHLVPDPSKSLREGAIVPWTTPAYRHELDELLALADDYGIPVDVPFSELKPEHLRLIRDGVPERNFGGLRGFFRWLERHRYKLGVRVFLNRWRSYAECPDCQGARLRPEALAVRLPEAPAEDRGGDWIFGRNIVEVCGLTVAQATVAFEAFSEHLAEPEREKVDPLLQEIRARLDYLQTVGLDYVTLDRPLRTLSDGEAKRVLLTTCLGSRLVNTLFILDEPSCGLHPRDNDRILNAVRRLRDARNTVVVVEHEAEFIRAADEVVDIGPGAGREGGRVVFQGSPEELACSEESLTGAYLSQRRSVPLPSSDRRAPQGWLRLSDVRHHNLRGVNAEFPRGVLCAVTGVSGSG